MVGDDNDRLGGHEIKAFRCDFELPKSRLAPEAVNYVAVRPFRDPAALSLCKRITLGLRSHGYPTTDAKHGKACDALFKCTLQSAKPQGYTINVMVNVEDRTETSIKLRLISWKYGSLLNLLWSIGRVRSGASDAWTDFCRTLDIELRKNVGAESVMWSLRKSRENRWSQFRL